MLLSALRSAAQAHVTVLNLNVYAANLAQTDTRFRTILNRADLVFCDGFGIRLGARLLGARVPSRITYADWLWVFATFCARHGFSLFRSGARPGVAEAAARSLQNHAPDLVIAGVHHGYFDKSSDGPANKDVLEAINAASPDILLVCFGMPLQEYWLEENWGEIKAHVVLTGGAALDYISGNLQRGPWWLTDYGFEWLARLLIEPKRLWQRYLMGNPAFLFRVLRQRLVYGPIQVWGGTTERGQSSAGARHPADETPDQ